MKTKNTADTIATTYADYEKDVSAVLANLDRTTPTPLIRQLQNMKKADQTARNNPATAEAITEAEEAHADHRDSVEHFDRIKARITATTAERLSAYYEAGGTSHRSRGSPPHGPRPRKSHSPHPIRPGRPRASVCRSRPPMADKWHGSKVHFVFP